jgi:ammonium transporter, Amt family
MFAAMSWCLMDYRLAKKWSLVGWCSGTISGLVAATPASGIITPWASIALGVVSGVLCNYSTKFKFFVGIDDALDVFAEHGVGGIIGLIFNAFFAADYIIGLDGVNTGITGGFLNGNYRLLYVQVAYIVACCAYMFVVSVIIAKGIDMIPGLHLRASEEAELLGMDDDQHGEFAYDYVEVCGFGPALVDNYLANGAPRFVVTTLRGLLRKRSRSKTESMLNPNTALRVTRISQRAITPLRHHPSPRL